MYTMALGSDWSKRYLLSSKLTYIYLDHIKQKHRIFTRKYLIFREKIHIVQQNGSVLLVFKSCYKEFKWPTLNSSVNINILLNILGILHTTLFFFNRISCFRCNEKGAIHVTHKPLDGGDTRSRTKSAMVKIRVRKSAA